VEGPQIVWIAKSSDLVALAIELLSCPASYASIDAVPNRRQLGDTPRKTKQNIIRNNGEHVYIFILSYANGMITKQYTE